MAPGFPPPTVDDLGIQGCLYLAALLKAQERRMPVAPTRRMALVAMDLLREQGVIEVPWPEPRWKVRPDADETPIERLQWRYCWTACSRERLLPALEEFLHSLPCDEYISPLLLRLWEEVSFAEAERFFEWQLTRHQFDPAWAQDLVFVHRDTRPALSIAQWRYCCWAATRHSASVSQRQRTPDPSSIREAGYSELRYRAKMVGTGCWPKCAFTPSNLVPDNALGRLISQYFVGSPETYWTSLRSTVDLLKHSCR